MFLALKSQCFACNESFAEKYFFVASLLYHYISFTKGIFFLSSVESTSVVQTSVMTDCLINIKNIISVLQRCSQQLCSCSHGDHYHSNSSGSTEMHHCTPAGMAQDSELKESHQADCSVYSTQHWTSMLAGILQQLMIVLIGGKGCA